MVSIVLMEEKIAQLDLSPIAFKFMLEEKEAWKSDISTQARIAESQYRMFLVLNLLYPGERIVPTQLVDKFWHYHILDTQKYMADCDSIFGHYFHHFPYFGIRSDNDKEIFSEAIERTRQLFLEHFDINPFSREQGGVGAICGGGCSGAHGSDEAAIFETKFLYEPRPRVV